MILILFGTQMWLAIGQAPSGRGVMDQTTITMASACILPRVQDTCALREQAQVAQENRERARDTCLQEKAPLIRVLTSLRNRTKNQILWLNPLFRTLPQPQCRAHGGAIRRKRRRTTSQQRSDKQPGMPFLSALLVSQLSVLLSILRPPPLGIGLVFSFPVCTDHDMRLCSRPQNCMQGHRRRSH